MLSAGLSQRVAGLASTALVLSIAAPFGGNWWYLLCLISPAAGAYYLKNAERQEEVLLYIFCVCILLCVCFWCRFWLLLLRLFWQAFLESTHSVVDMQLSRSRFYLG